MNQPKVSIIVPNWNGKESLAGCLGSLLKQTLQAHLIVVDNGSGDGSVELLQDQYPQIELLANQKNLGFAGGVNVGIRQAMKQGAKYIALFNNDAVADERWLEELVSALEARQSAGIATCKLLSRDGQLIDSTGECYTSWGLPYPRGRGEKDSGQYDSQTEIFAASGGASLYRVSMLEQIGLFDEDFFAYYEDVDLSFRAQLAGWQVLYAPKAIAYHATGTTSNRIKGFHTYQTMKNLPLIAWKCLPLRLWPAIMPRLKLAYILFFASAVQHGNGWQALKGWLQMLGLLPKKLLERHRIQKSRKVSLQGLKSMLTYDLPPQANRLRRLRNKWWKVTRRRGA